MSAEPTQYMVPVGAHVQCTDGYGGSVTRLIVDPLARRLTHIVVQDGTVCREYQERKGGYISPSFALLLIQRVRG